jgi:hypothetical protein
LGVGGDGKAIVEWVYNFAMVEADFVEIAEKLISKQRSG